MQAVWINFLKSNCETFTGYACRYHSVTDYYWVCKINDVGNEALRIAAKYLFFKKQKG